MSLRFIYGRAGSGKTRYCLEEIKARIEEEASHPLILLVPEQFSFQAEKDLITMLGRGGSIETQVLSFQRMAFRIFNQLGGITYPHIHTAGKCMLLYRILDKMKGEFIYFAKSAERPGFVNTLSTLISEFKRYQVTPRMLKEFGEDLGEDQPLKEKLQELHGVYAAFEETIAERYRDTDDDLTMAGEKLQVADLYDGSEIWVGGFTGFTPQEYLVLERLLQKACRVNVSLCTDHLEGVKRHQENDVFFGVKQVYRRLTNFADDQEIVIEPSVLLEEQPLFRFRNSPELAHLEKNLNDFPCRTFSAETENIALFSYANVFSEIEGAAQDILSLCRDQGLRYRDIGLVVRNLADYEQLIQVIFDEYEIPCFIDRKIDITNHPLVRLILSMLDLFIENWTYEDVFSYLKTGLTDVERNDIDILENYVLACGIRGRRWTDGQDWQMSTNFLPDERESGQEKERLKEINRIRIQVVSPLLAFRKTTKGKRSAEEICGALYDFLYRIGVPERIEAYIDHFRKLGELNLANEYGQVWNIVMAVFDQTVEVMGEETFGLERFANILKIGLAEYQVGLVPPSLDQVLVGNVERSKSHEIQALFILGMNDGVFPASGMEEGILSDLDRDVFTRAGIELAGDTRRKAFDEQYLIYRALTIPEKFLRLSWPIADQEGKAMRPSMIISRLRKIFPRIKESSYISPGENVPADASELMTGRKTTFQHMISALRQKADGEGISPIWAQVYRWFYQQDEWREKCLSMRAAFLYQNLAQPVSKVNIDALYGDPVYSSVSRLEKFTTCPFAYYMQYGLKAQERKIFRLSPPDVGTFMHGVIERFSSLMEEGEISWRTMDRPWCGEKISLIIDEMLEEMQGSGLAGSKRYTALAIRMKRVMTRAVWLIAEHIRRSSFDPIGYEMAFGEEGNFPPITIQLDSGAQIKLTGRIDRVDACKTEEGTYLRIVDYKSGAKDFKLSDLYYGLQIQLITYLDAIWSQKGGGESSPLLPGGMLYFRIDDPIIREKGKITEEEIEQAIMKKLKMRGLLLADVKLIRAMDQTMEGDSLIIPARINKDGTLGRASAATLDQFKLLRKYVGHLLKGLCQEMMQGNVSIQPYKKKDHTSCAYCSFSAVCQFDPMRKENTYRLFYEHKDQEVWKMLKGGDE
ncbi:helicase-exonuclease AddAB subunit AddB [Dehalobacterium formicoaceticum]|uniref:helicase-exonuclease AddAB subunit AddB n=1 Tax=Dehalobacterium formicoaceticum TaxID=51515 RepID=UPI0031F6657B